VAELTSGVHRLDLVLNEAERAASVAGRVIDEEGVPVAGAEIRLGNPAGSWSGTESLPDGSFVVEKVPPGTHRLSAHGSGILDPDPGRQLQVAGEPIAGIELRVARTEGITLTGRLLGLTPEEARWVRIDAWQKLRFDRYVPGAVEGADGYRIAGLHPGSWTVVAVHADGRRAEGTVELGPEPAPPGLDLEFPSGFTLRGRATLDGAPFAGAQVEIAPADPQGGLPGRQARAAQDGSFAFTHLRPGRYRLFAVDEQSGVGAGRQVAVEGDTTVRVELTTAPLRGRVLAADGTPVEGATLLLMGRDDALGVQFRVPPVRTDGDGAFGLPRLATGAYRATVEAEGFAPRELDVQVRPDAGPLEVRIEPAAGG
ncbi:MAG TPA: carboxypeptidase-like regulatory domain-containing protein, partial [Thermoanaerobaculia bacterium]|nr:carboxypeptidase-like regulatory domain-containing protein [Thermoanaerobaculia bacterium]